MKTNWRVIIFNLILTLAVAFMSVGYGIKLVEVDAGYYVFDNFINNSDFKMCMGIDDIQYKYGYIDRKERGELNINDTLIVPKLNYG